MRHPALLFALLFLLGRGPSAVAEDLDLPWRAAGLSEAEAAAHLLDRLAFGPRPGEVERVVAMGLDTWLSVQLDAALPERRLAARLASYRTLELTTRELARRYPNPGLVILEARRAGAIDADAELRGAGGERDGALLRAVIAFARERGYRPQRELLGELAMQKLERAVFAENQLVEVLTDFWFNHFNVSIGDSDVRVFVPAYERDAVRPHVLGPFRAMLEATARHPAMLLYLDNARSVAAADAPRTFDAENLRRRRRFAGRVADRGGGRDGPAVLEDLDPELRRVFEENRPQGLNENYARELLELHTVGVDGGFTQEDVVAVARAFSGWTTWPPGRLREEVEERLARARARLGRIGLGLGDLGFVLEEDFVFRADAHDAGPKTVLGRRLPAGRGIEDGRDVLDLLAVHPATARHLAAKLAVRFVADDPPPALVERLAATWRESGGDLRRVMVELVESPELWSEAARRQKIKSPFELAVSALRALDAEVDQPLALADWIARMGQPLYAYQAPTGYPDRGEAWVNTGSLLQRMNFGLRLATGRIPGVKVDLGPGPGRYEPESLEAALAAWTELLLPGRDPGPTVSRLAPLVRDPRVLRRVEEAAPTTPTASPELDLGVWDDLDLLPGPMRGGRMLAGAEWPAVTGGEAGPMAHVVGLILGSPEFQRR